MCGARALLLAFLVLIVAVPGGLGADPQLVHMDWRSGSALIGLHGTGHTAVNEARFTFEAGPCHRDLRLDLLYEPASIGVPGGVGPYVPYVFHAAIYHPNGTLFSERSLSSSNFGHRMGILPTAGTYVVTIRLDLGAAVEWDVRLRGWMADGETTCELFLNEVETNPGSETAQEWVELYNAGDTPFDASGWQLWGESWNDNSSAIAYIIPNGTTVPAGGHLRVYLQDGALLGDVNETVVLQDPEGRPVDRSILLTDTDDDIRTWSRVTDGAGSWRLGTATPGAPNDP